MCQGRAEAAFCCKLCAAMLGIRSQLGPAQLGLPRQVESPRAPQLGGRGGASPAPSDVFLKGALDCAVSCIDDLPFIILGYG